MLLQDDGRIVLGALPETLPDQQMVKLDQRCLHHARGPERHAGAGGGIQDPCRGHDDDARRRLEVDNGAGYTLLAALIPDTTPIEGVPAIVDLDLLPDMGRMAARSPSGARHGCSAAPIAVVTRAAFMYTLIGTAKLNDLDPQAWLADVLARIANLPLSRLPELLPWEWARRRDAVAIAA